MEKGKKHMAMAIAALLTAGTAATTWAASAKIESIDRTNGMVTLKLSSSAVRGMHEGQSVRVTAPLPAKRSLRHRHSHKKAPVVHPGAAPGATEAPGAASEGAPGSAPSGAPAHTPGGGT